MAQVFFYCEDCNTSFEPLCANEPCPRCRAHRLNIEFEALKQMLAEMNEIALRPEGGVM